MRTVSTPKTREALVTELTSLYAVTMATEWRKAGLVYQWTTSKEGRPKAGETDKTFTVSGFAALGIPGLKGRPTINAYRAAWESAAKHMGPDHLNVKPGDDLTLPELTWTDHFKTTGGASPEAVRKAIINDPSVVSEAIKRVPDVANAVAMDDDAANEVMSRSATKRMTGTPVGPVTPAMSPHVNTPGDDIMLAFRLLTQAMHAVKEGRYTLDGTEETAIRLVYMTIKDYTDDSEPTVFADIDDFLATVRSK